MSEDKLRYQLMSHREYHKRESLVSTPGVGCTTSLIEQFYLHKLGLILEQKRASRAQTSESKKRPRDEMAMAHDTGDLDYKADQILNNYNVFCRYFSPSDCSEMQLSLNDMKPSEIILFEPQLEFMRSLEVYSA